MEWDGVRWHGKFQSHLRHFFLKIWFLRENKKETHTHIQRETERNRFWLRCVSQYALGSHKFESLWSTRTFPVIHHPDCMAKPTVSGLCGHSARGAILDKVLKIHIPRKRNNKILMLSVYFNLTPLEKGFLLELSRSYCF